MVELGLARLDVDTPVDPMLELLLNVDCPLVVHVTDVGVVELILLGEAELLLPKVDCPLIVQVTEGGEVELEDELVELLVV